MKLHSSSVDTVLSRLCGHQFIQPCIGRESIDKRYKRTSVFHQTTLEAAPSADVFKAQHSELEGNDIGPQLQRFDAVDEDSALVEASSGWRQLDAALARSERNLFASISETLNGNISQTTARTPKSVTDKPLPHSSGYAAALASAPVLPQISVTPVALPIGTPLCFLPAERGLVSYPTPPPYGC